MDEGDVDFSAPDMGGEYPSSCSMDSFFDEILNDTQQHACTHTHTCNPPGPDLSHSHTCFHVHTKILSAPTEETSESAGGGPAKKRPHGNREAVRRYRQKIKAQAASLEDEVTQLRKENKQLREEKEQLREQLQGKAALVAEVGRLRCMLVDIRGRIDGELGAFPYQKSAKWGADLVSNSCNLRCDDQAYCLQPRTQGKGGGEVGSLNGQGFGACDIGNIPCMANSASGPGSKDYFGCGAGNAMPSGCTRDTGKLKGVRVATEEG